MLFAKGDMVTTLTGEIAEVIGWEVYASHEPLYWLKIRGDDRKYLANESDLKKA